MRWLGDKRFHTLLLLTERPGQWSPWYIAAVPLLVAGGLGLIWARAAGSAALGWGIALCLLAFTLTDWVLLELLPRRGFSFGPVQPPLLGLVLFRGLIGLAAVPFAGRWGLPVLVAVGLVQATLFLFVAYGMLVEPFRLKVTREHVTTPALSNPGTPLRLVQVSDLHVERTTRRERALPGLVAGLEPDVIFLTGDFLNTTYYEDQRALTDLRALLAQFSAPGGIFAVWGTPEVDLPDFLRPTFAELGIVILEDEAVEVNVRDQRLWLVGLRCTRDLEAGQARLRRLLGAAPPELPTVLLHHTPDMMPGAAALGVDLVLSGHTHGGQWRVPGFGAILTSSRFWKRYEAGHYVEGTTHLYVSRGLGLEGFGAPRARFFCPPELVLVTLSGSGKRS